MTWRGRNSSEWRDGLTIGFSVFCDLVYQKCIGHWILIMQSDRLLLNPALLTIRKTQPYKLRTNFAKRQAPIRCLNVVQPGERRPPSRGVGLSDRDSARPDYPDNDPHVALRLQSTGELSERTRLLAYTRNN